MTRNLCRLVTILGCLTAAAAATGAPTTVAVLNFAQTSEGPSQSAHTWMQKGLADLLINDLATCETLRVITREHMQMLLQEAGLQRNRLRSLPEEQADQLKQHLAVDRLVFGSYTVEGDALILQVRIIDQSDGSVVASFAEHGPLANVLQAEKTLARKLLGRFTGKDGAEDAWILPKWTDSTAAAQRLYEGVDLFDQGDYLRAWYAFRQALRIDPQFADARYWSARMQYYRTDYDHARIDYRRFVYQHPKHARIGDAVMELVHSVERASDDPDELLALYDAFRTQDWSGVYVHNQADYLSRSPLGLWIANRRQGALAYVGRHAEAYDLLRQELEAAPATNRNDAAWQEQGRDLLAALAAHSEDEGGPRLGEGGPYTNVFLTAEQPWFDQDLRPLNLHGNRYKFGANHRILAPPGCRFASLKSEIRRSNDPGANAVCRLSIRKYRYVDIDTCWTADKELSPGKRYVRDVKLPVNCTWFYLRPEYDGRSGNYAGQDHAASFDGWRIDATFEPLPEHAGGVSLRVENVMEFNAIVDDRYARCGNGVIGNLVPGLHSLRIENMYGRKEWGCEPLQTTFEVLPDTYRRLELRLSLRDAVRQLGWTNPVGVAYDYPSYKHSPRRIINWRDGAPAWTAQRSTGRQVAVWAHLDDLWCATSTNGQPWSTPVNLPAPINSAHVELNPRLIEDESGRLVLLFLSDRGLLRNLATYICWSRDLQTWSRPLLISPSHQQDQCLLQDEIGRYLIFSAPSGAGAPRIEWRESADLLSWSEPRCIALPEWPTCLACTQDGDGRFHLVWKAVAREEMAWQSRMAPAVHYMSSRDLAHWSAPALLPVEGPYCINVTTVATANRLWIGVGTEDPLYGGSRAGLTLFSRGIRDRAAPWQTSEVPADTVGGLCALTRIRREADALMLSWTVTDMTLNTERFAGPVFVMAGSPVARNPVQADLRCVSMDWFGRLATNRAPVRLPPTPAHIALALVPPPSDTVFAPRPVLSDGEYTRRSNELLKGAPTVASLEKNRRPVVGRRIVRVADGTQAQHLGMQPGEVLVALDGVPIPVDNTPLRRHRTQSQVLTLVSAAGVPHELTVSPGMIGLVTRPARQADVWYFSNAQRPRQFDRDMHVALAAADSDSDLSEHAWHRLLAAGFSDRTVIAPCLARLAHLRGHDAAAGALLRDWHVAADVEPLLLDPDIRSEIDLASGAYAAPDRALTPVPAHLAAVAWPELASTPAPSLLLETRTAHNLLADVAEAPGAWSTPQETLARLRARQPLSLLPPRSTGTQHVAVRLGRALPSGAVQARFRTRTARRSQADSADHWLWIAVLDGDAGSGEPATREPDTACLLGFALRERGDRSTYVLLAAAGPGDLARIEAPALAADFVTPHTVHLIWRDGQGEIFLDQRRLALIPVPRVFRQPVFVVQTQGLHAFLDEIDAWEIN